MMKKIFLALLLLMSCAVMMPMQAEAQSGGVKKLERECQRAVKSLPLRLREAFLAQKYQLLFLEGQGNPYDGIYTSNEPVYKRGQVIRHETISFPRAASAARFVGSDGQVYHFYTVHGNAPQAHMDWKQAGRTFHHTGAKVMYPHFKKEIRDLELKRAEYFLEQMPPRHRQAFIAAMYELCYMPDGSPGFSKIYEEEFCGEQLPTYLMKQGCAFIGADGAPVSYHQVMKEMEQTKGFYHWKSLRLAWHHGCKKMLQPYKEEVEAMRKYHAELGSSRPMPTNAPAPAVKEPSFPSPMGNPTSTPMGSSSAMGSTVNPAQEG